MVGKSSLRHSTRATQTTVEWGLRPCLLVWTGQVTLQLHKQLKSYYLQMSKVVQNFAKSTLLWSKKTSMKIIDLQHFENGDSRVFPMPKKAIQLRALVCLPLSTRPIFKTSKILYKKRNSFCLKISPKIPNHSKSTLSKRGLHLIPIRTKITVRVAIIVAMRKVQSIMLFWGSILWTIRDNWWHLPAMNKPRSKLEMVGKMVKNHRSQKC